MTAMTGTARAAVLTWDYRQQPDLDQLDRILRELTGGTVRLAEVDTGSDECAIVIATADLDDGAAHALYKQYQDTGADIIGLNGGTLT